MPEDAFDIMAKTFLSTPYLKSSTQINQLAKILRLNFLDGLRRGREIGKLESEKD